MIFWLAEVFFALAVLAYIASMLQKSRKWLLFVLVACDFCFAAYYLFLDCFTAMCFNVFEGVLVICLYFFEKFKKSHTHVVVAASVVWIADVLATIFTWAGPLQIVSFLACSCFLLGLCLRRLLVTKILAMISIALATTYWFCVSTVFNGFVGVCMFAGATAGFVLTLLSELKKKELQTNHAKKMVQKTVTKTALKKEKTA